MGVLDGRVALITGVGAGMGSAMAAAYADAGIEDPLFLRLVQVEGKRHQTVGSRIQGFDVLNIFDPK